jgi:hypothetical protein
MRAADKKHTISQSRPLRMHDPFECNWPCKQNLWCDHNPQVWLVRAASSFPSPNGAQDASPGQRPGFTPAQNISSPVRAEQNGRMPDPNRTRDCAAPSGPLQGLGIFRARKPRASLRFALGYHRSPFQGCGFAPPAHKIPSNDTIGAFATVWRIGRKLGVVYEGAIYHVRNRGHRCEAIFLNDVARRSLHRCRLAVSAHAFYHIKCHSFGTERRSSPPNSEGPTGGNAVQSLPPCCISIGS